MRHSPERPAVWSSVKWQRYSNMAILWKGIKWFSEKFQSCKFQRTCTRSDEFVWTAGVQYVTENALFIFTPGFLSIKLWWCERRTWGALPSRHFGDGVQVQREMERCHVRWLLLDDERMLLKQNTIDRPKEHVVKVSHFPFIFIVHITMIVLLSRKQELTKEF